MLKGRKALIGYATYVVGKRVLKHVVKKQTRKRFARFVEPDEVRASRRRKLPIIGAALAVVAGGAALLIRSRRPVP